MSVKEINYILKRVLQMIPVLLLVMVLIFALIRFIPGDPADVMLGARATEESRAMLHAKMGIDKPIYEQFFLFMKNWTSGNPSSAASLFRRSLRAAFR